MDTALKKPPANPPRLRTGIRQERARQRRHHLSQVVMQLIRERGFDAISVNEVAQRAAMSVGGLYRHIDTKSDLLEMVCDEINDNLIEDMISASEAAHGVEDKLKAAICTYWQRHWDAAAAILVAYREYQSLGVEARQRYTAEERKIAEFFGDLIRAGAAIDVFRKVDDRLLAHEIILLSHMRALKGWMFEGRKREAVLSEHLDLIFSRLRPLAGAVR
jgi:TetR/AcrR family transcriptional regulator, cholesterol catabolism regulator